MTLCVAWDNGRNIHFASDSRISSGDKYSDYGIKVVPVPIKVFSPGSEKGEISIVFERTYGMCFAGSFTGAYVIREFLIIILQNLQSIPGLIDVSFLKICNIVNKFYNHLVQEIQRDLNYDHSIDFFFAGYCPQEKALKIAKFYVDSEDNCENYIPKYEIIKQSNFIDAIGTGSEEFKKSLDKIADISILNSKVLKAIKQTIDSKKIPSVGGNIQYGNFDNSFDFTTFGIIDYTYGEKGLLKSVTHCIAGLNMVGTEFDQHDFELNIMGSYIDPFRNS